MAEEKTQTEETVALVDHEGNLREGWRDALPEDIRDEESLKLVTTFGEGMKQLVHAQKMVGKEKVALPGENATDEELEIFYDQIGRPKTVDDYAYKKPEGIPDEKRSDEAMKDIRAFAHANGFTQRQFNARMKAADAQELDDIKTAGETLARETGEAETELKRVLGMKYEESVHAADIFVNTFTREGEHREAYIAKYGRDPMLIQMFAEAGAKLIESDVMIADLSQKAPKEAQAELDELKASDDYHKYERGELQGAKHENMTRKVTELFNTINPAEKKVG